MDAMKWAAEARKYATETARAAAAGDQMKAQQAADNLLGDWHAEWPGVTGRVTVAEHAAVVDDSCAAVAGCDGFIACFAMGRFRRDTESCHARRYTIGVAFN